MRPQRERWSAVDLSRSPLPEDQRLALSSEFEGHASGFDLDHGDTSHLVMELDQFAVNDGRG